MTSFLLSVAPTSLLIQSSLFRGQLSERNGQIIGYCPLGNQHIRVGEFLKGIRVRKHRYGHLRVTDKQSCTGITFQ